MANEAVKKLVDVGFDTEKVVADVVQKTGIGAIASDAVIDGKDIAALVQNWAQVRVDIAGLSDPANRADLEAYVLAKLGGAVNAPKVTAYIEAVFKFGEAIEQLLAARAMA